MNDSHRYAKKASTIDYKLRNIIPIFQYFIPSKGQNTLETKYSGQFDRTVKQECIPVGCVPPAHRPYLPGPGGGVI